MQDVSELRAQESHLLVRSFRAVELQALGPDERVLLLPAELPPPFLAEGPIAASGRLALRSSLPEGHGSRPKRPGIYDSSAAPEIQISEREKVRDQEAEERAAIQQREARLRIAFEHEPHEEEKAYEAPGHGAERDEGVRCQAREGSARCGQERECRDTHDSRDDEIPEADEHRFPFLPGRDLRLQALLFPERVARLLRNHQENRQPLA